MKIYIKNMVCHRCIRVVTEIFHQTGLHPTQVTLGQAEIYEDKIDEQMDQLSQELKKAGFEILKDKHDRVVEKIKNLITNLVHHNSNQLQINLSTYLMNHIHQEYSSLSHTFSETEGLTIERYYILQKIEKVKELLSYDELTLNQIADQLNYSSVAYLSSQFKKITGLTPTQFKKSKDPQRKGLDQV